MPSPILYFEEMHRVLKPEGLSFTAWGPAWSSKRGHHLRPHGYYGLIDFGNFTYINDGSIIPDWGHLNMTKKDLQKHLVSQKSMPTELADQIVGSFL